MTRPLHPTALVTGADDGLGRAIAAGLKARGCRVTLAARDEDAGRRAAAEVGTGFARIDLLDPDSYFDAMTRSGGFDILVNNAAPPPGASLLSPRSDFTEAMEVMVAAPLDLIRLSVPHWRAVGWGRIVNVSSGAGAHAEGLAGPGASGIARAAMNALTRTLPRDLPPGVKVNAFCPGGTGTPSTAADPGAFAEGADTGVWLALLPDDGPTGGFFRNRQPIAW